MSRLSQVSFNASMKAFMFIIFSPPSEYCFTQIEVLSLVFLFHRKVNRILFISLTIDSLGFRSVIKKMI